MDLDARAFPGVHCIMAQAGKNLEKISNERRLPCGILAD